MKKWMMSKIQSRRNHHRTNLPRRERLMMGRKKRLRHLKKLKNPQENEKWLAFMQCKL